MKDLVRCSCVADHLGITWSSTHNLRKDTCNVYSYSRRRPAGVLFTAVSVPPPVPHRYPSVGGLFAPTAQAKSKVRNLLDRVLGKTMPAGIVKTNGRIEATEVDVVVR